MGANTSVKVTFKAYDKVNELIFPNSYTIQEFMNYIRVICNTAVVIDMTPTSKQPNI